MVNVVITGSTKGIGFGLAKEIASRGNNVTITGRTQTSIDDAIQRIEKNDGSVVGLPCEVSNKDDVQALWDKAKSSFGSVDIWINNAGLARTTHNIIEYSAGDVQSMVKTNVIGTIYGCQVAGKGMLEQSNQGYKAATKIFNILGGGSDGQYFSGMGIYGTTKRGLHYLTQAMIKEFKDSNIIVASIRPGIIITEAVIREAHDDMESFQKQRKIMNVLADKVETVAPFLVDGIMNTTKPGTEISWLTGTKIAKRMMLSRFTKQEDKFAEYGL